MGFYTKLKLKQTCVLCLQTAQYCVCNDCQQDLIQSTKRCISCAIPLNNKLDFCGACLNKSPYFSKAYSLYSYNSTCAQLIKTFKFKHQLCIGDFFAHQLATTYQQKFASCHYDAIIPMPLSQQRLKDRGFNQSIELVRRLNNIIVDINAVKRIKNTRTLSQLNRKERQIEIKGAFQAHALSYRKVLLVDDVMSTYASMNELAKTLLRAGVGRCDAWVVARR
jgi:ComF family protein